MTIKEYLDTANIPTSLKNQALAISDLLTQEPDCAYREDVVFFSWNKNQHHFEIEIAADGTEECFYMNRNDK